MIGRIYNMLRNAIGIGDAHTGIGDVTRRLRIRRAYTDKPSWHWKETRFQRMELGLGMRMNPHVVIVGESGSGKSNACKIMVREMASKGARVAILDPHNEYLGIAESIGAEVYDAAYNGINIFELDGVSEKERANELTNMFKRIFRLGEVQGYELYRCIMFTYTRMGNLGRAPNIHDLLYTINIFKKHAGTAETRILDGLSRRLSLIDTGAFSRSTEMERVMSGNSIFLLSGLHTNESQSVYIEGFLRKVYSRMLSSERKEGERLYIVIDEAEKLGQKSVAGRIAAEGRKYGIGIVAMAQRAKSVESEIRTNASLFISFYQREPEELNYLANLIAGGNELNRFAEVKKAIRSLGRGSAVVMDSAERNPFIARFDKSVGEKACISYEIIKLSRHGRPLAEIREEIGKKGLLRIEVDRKLDEMVKNDTISRYDVECWSRYDGPWYISMRRNSAEHDVCVEVIRRHLEHIGIKCSVYNSSYGPDLIAVSEGKRIAVEYETGMKRIESTQEMITKRGALYAHVLVIVNNGKMDEYSLIKGATVISISEFLNESSAQNLIQGDATALHP